MVTVDNKFRRVHRLAIGELAGSTRPSRKDGRVTTSSRPVRRTRPGSRRSSIIEAATRLFRTHGYEHVSMSDLAEEVAVGPSALYRHFPSKQDLLREVVNSGLDPMTAEMAALDFADRPAVMAAVATLAVDNSHLGAIWLREARHLPTESADEISQRLRAVAATVADAIGRARPELTEPGRELIAWTVFGLLLSPSFTHLDISRGRHIAVLAEMGCRALDAPVSPEFRYGTTAVPTPGLLPLSRREALLGHAIQLFAERRYAGVGIEEVAASLGMAGPAIYKHFSSKSELLADALGRGAGYLALRIGEALAGSQTPAQALHRAAGSYIDLAVTHPALVNILLTEVRNLTEPYREFALQTQRDYADEWTHLLRQTWPNLDKVTAGVEVRATLSVINTISEIRHLQSGPGIADALLGVVDHLLDLHAN
ncbi:TetR/AcrR family transcriptional regulator [Nocardia sp. NPDC059239]|uniref:TetR/AcrR family transcriptional regulator n=1 Tax=unclassified Nocardia TaxID=2637762 RepID=UPI00369C6909